MTDAPPWLNLTGIFRDEASAIGTGPGARENLVVPTVETILSARKKLLDATGYAIGTRPLAFGTSAHIYPLRRRETGTESGWVLKCIDSTGIDSDNPLAAGENPYTNVTPLDACLTVFDEHTAYKSLPGCTPLLCTDEKADHASMVRAAALIVERCEEVRSLTEEGVGRMLRDIGTALARSRARRICHGDVHSRQILYSKARDRFVLTDWAPLESKGAPPLGPLSPPESIPEIARFAPAATAHARDEWALACVAIAHLCGDDWAFVPSDVSLAASLAAVEEDDDADAERKSDTPRMDKVLVAAWTNVFGPVPRNIGEYMTRPRKSVTEFVHAICELHKKPVPDTLSPAWLAVYQMTGWSRRKFAVDAM